MFTSTIAVRQLTYLHLCRRDMSVHFLGGKHIWRKRQSLSGYVCDSFQSATRDRQRSEYLHVTPIRRVMVIIRPCLYLLAAFSTHRSMVARIELERVLDSHLALPPSVSDVKLKRGEKRLRGVDQHCRSQSGRSHKSIRVRNHMVIVISRSKRRSKTTCYLPYQTSLRRLSSRLKRKARWIVLCPFDILQRVAIIVHPRLGRRKLYPRRWSFSFVGISYLQITSNIPGRVDALASLGVLGSGRQRGLAAGGLAPRLLSVLL